MLWSRFTILSTAIAVLGASTGVTASEHWELFGKRQDSPSSNSASSTTASATTSVSSSSSGSASASSSASATSNTSAASSASSSPTESKGSSTTSTEFPPRPTDSDFEECHNKNAPKWPICKPKNGQDVNVGEKYYVTWDVDAFPLNSTVQIVLDYVNTTQNEGKSAFLSDRTPNKVGFVVVDMDKAWLRDESRNNLSIVLVNYELSSPDHRTTKSGPMVSLIKKPLTHYPPPPPSKPDKIGLMIGLPIALVVIFAILCGLCLGMRKHRRIGLGSIMGRGKGYGSGKSRLERLGERGRPRDRSVRMDDLEGIDQYTDEPRARREDDGFDELGRERTDTFRTELGRMKTWK